MSNLTFLNYLKVPRVLPWAFLGSFSLGNSPSKNVYRSFLLGISYLKGLSNNKNSNHLTSVPLYLHSITMLYSERGTQNTFLLNNLAE